MRTATRIVKDATAKLRLAYEAAAVHEPPETEYVDNIGGIETNAVLYALDAETGKPVWETRVSYVQNEQSLTIAPRIAKGKVIVGPAGGDRPTRGFFAAYDAETGKEAWRFYTVPGDPAKGFESDAMKKAAATWEGNWWKLGGGGAVWDGISYDPESELLYVGTGNAEPWPEALRTKDTSSGSDNLYVASIVAVNVRPGRPSAVNRALH